MSKITVSEKSKQFMNNFMTKLENGHYDKQFKLNRNNEVPFNLTTQEVDNLMNNYDKTIKYLSFLDEEKESTNNKRR